MDHLAFGSGCRIADWCLKLATWVHCSLLAVCSRLVLLCASCNGRRVQRLAVVLELVLVRLVRVNMLML